MSLTRKNMLKTVSVPKPSKRTRNKKLRFPKHPRPFAAGAQLPSSHYNHPYISEATLPPKPCEAWIEKKVLEEPWKGTNPSLVNRKELPFHLVEKLLSESPINKSSAMECSTIYSQGNKEESQKKKTAEDQKTGSKEREYLELPARWMPVHSTKTGREGDLSWPEYMGDMEMLLWMRQHDPDMLMKILLDEKSGRPNPLFPTPKKEPESFPKGGPWLYNTGDKRGSGGLFTPSFPYITSDVMPPNDFEMWCNSLKYSEFQQGSAFQTGAANEYIEESLVQYNRLPNKFHIPPRNRLASSNVTSNNMVHIQRNVSDK